MANQLCLEYFGFQHPDLELEGGARSVVQFEGILPEAAPGVVYAPVGLDGQASVVVDVAPEVYEIVDLFVYPAGNLDAEYGDGIQHPPLAQYRFDALAPYLRTGFEMGDRVVGASALSPSDAAGQEAMVGSAQRVVVARARASHDTAVQHCLEYFGFQHPNLEL